MTSRRPVRTAGPETAAAFAEWVTPHLLAMARLAARIAPAADRDDVVQEALARAWQKRSRFDPMVGSPAAWLLTITADQARKATRRHRPHEPIADIQSQIRSTDDHLDVEYAIARLPKRQRLAVDCYYFAGLSVMETATIMKCSEGTVKSTLHDARQRLRHLLRGEA